MLDVHAPHETVHNWKDVFIHIAIIAVGLLIAIGLEQTVEFFHHHYQVKQTREALRQELEFNHDQFARNTANLRWETAEYQNNLLVFEYIQQHPGTPQEKLPGVLMWLHIGTSFSYGAWDAAQQSGLTALMPQDEVAHDSAVYARLHDIDTNEQADFLASHEAERYLYRDPDPTHLTTAQVAEEIDLTTTLLMQHYRHGNAMQTLARRYPDFTPAPANEDQRLLQHYDPSTEKLLAPAETLTLDRMSAAGFPVTGALIMTPSGPVFTAPAPPKK